MAGVKKHAECPTTAASGLQGQEYTKLRTLVVLFSMKVDSIACV